jgi:hypothetical protein
MRSALSLLLTFLASCTSMPARADNSIPNACAEAYVRGQVLRNDHKLVEARNVFRDCAQPTCKDFIVKDCSAWLDMVQTSLPAVVPIAIDEGGNALFAIKVSMDGAAFLSVLDGRSVEVDPGMHTFEFETPDGNKTEKTVMVPEGDKWVRVAVTLSAPPTAPAAPSRSPEKSGPVPVTPVASGAARRDGDRSTSSHAVPWRGVGLVVAGVGVAGLGVGTFFGLDALTKRNAAGCGSQEVCPSADAKNELNAARHAGNFANAFLAAGAVLTVSGIVLWALAPRHPVRVATRLDKESLTLVASGSW